jgi:glycosyltransferase involved in cell wall biosynthesis
VRLCVFVYSMAGGGAERAAALLCREFSTWELDLAVLLVRPEGIHLGDLPAGTRVRGLPRVLCHFGYVGHLLATAWALRRIRPSHVLAVGEWPNVLADPACRLAGLRTRVVISEHTSRSFVEPLNHYDIGPLTKWSARRAYRRARTCVAVSQTVARRLADLGACDPRDIVVIPNPVDVDAIRDAAAEPVEHPWLTDPKPPVLVAVGRLHPAKDHPTLLRAFARIRQARDARLLILGEGPEEGALKELAEALAVTQAVEFVGHQPNPFSYMSRAAVLLHAARYEGFGNIFAEAMACGLPVVSTDCVELPTDLLRTYEERLTVVPVGDAGALAEAALSMLDRRPSLGPEPDLGELAPRLVAERYLRVLESGAGATR